MEPKSSFKKYYENETFRENHKLYKSEKITCECGTIVTRGNISTHRKSPKHNKCVEIMNKKKLLLERQEKIGQRIQTLQVEYDDINKRQKK